MNWDIYGQPLRSGYCEVHPWVGEEYPCGHCLREQEQYQREKEEYEQAMAKQYEQYCQDQLEQLVEDLKCQDGGCI